MPKIIGICGVAGSGKSTAAEFFQKFYADVYTEAFANSLKEICNIIAGLDVADHKEDHCIDIFGESMTGRRFLQYVGTEVFRSKDENVWVDIIDRKLFGDSSPYEDYETVIIEDVRFQNEVDFIAKRGGHLIKLSGAAMLTPDIYSHASEQIHKLNFSLLGDSYHEVVNHDCNLIEYAFRLKNLASTELSNILIPI